MRALGSPPTSVVDHRTLSPAYGSYRGALRRSDLSPLLSDPMSRVLTEKRWIWGSITKDDLMLAFAVVDLGYVSNGFAYAYTPNDGVVARTSVVGAPRLSRVKQTATHRIDARMRDPRLGIRLTHDDHDPQIELALRSSTLEIHATLDTRGAPEPITAIAPLQKGVVDVTEKRVLMPVRGSALVAGKRTSLDGALGGYDFSHGIMPRHTQWNWAFFMGHDVRGVPVALNVVAGWTREHECALWAAGELVGVPEAVFEYESARPTAPWKVTTPDGAIDLTLTPRAIHAEEKNLGVVRSAFKQAIGSYRGTLRAGDRSFEIADAIGVAEEQDVVW
jgi:hypothetical protein